MPTTRRALLSAALLAGSAASATTLSGCTLNGSHPFDPTIADGQRRGDIDAGPATPTPTPAPEQLAAVTALNELSRALGGFVQATGASAPHIAWAKASQSALNLHESMLRRPDPLAGDLPAPRNPAPTTAPSPQPVAKAATELRATAQRVESTLLASASTSDRDDLTLLWGSLAMFAAACATPLNVAPAQARTLPHHFDDGTLAEARSVAIAQLFRAEQAAAGLVGALGVADSTRDLRTRLRARRTQMVDLRAKLQDQLRSAGGTPPPPETGYELPARPTAAGVGRLMAAVETDVFNALARQFCASEPGDRPTSFTQWKGQLAQVQRWTSVSRFPGWV